VLSGQNLVRPDDNEIPPASLVTNRVFIISRDPLRAFIAALNPALRGCEEFTIIVDRRRGGLPDVAARVAIERRHHPSVDAKVERDGFAIVPRSTIEDPQNPPGIERVVDHQSAVDDAAADEHELQRILKFKRREARVGRLVRVSAIVGAVSVLVVLFAQMPAGKALLNRARMVALPTSERTPEPPIEPHARFVAEAPALAGPSRPPAEHIGSSHDKGRTPTEVMSLPPSPHSNASRQFKRRSANPESAPPTRPESISVPADSAPTPRLGVTPPTPARPLTVASPASPSPAETAPEPARPTQSNSPPRPPSARGLEAWIQSLQSHVKADVDTAGAEAKRQIDELKWNTMKSVDATRRAWNNVTHAVFGQGLAPGAPEVAAKPR